MIRRLAIGTIAAAALLGAGFSGQAQAQTQTCATWITNGACGESHFNQAPDPSDPRPAMQIAGQAQLPPAAAQAATGSASQAGPQADSQPAGEE
ncbi:MAG TPA: hypothetical protein VK066_31170 [Chloroflexota bacterium]|nr:hypothetical protein [Chloroflexota bacterium]